MIRVLIVYDVDGWAYHSRALALQQYAPEGFEIRIAGMETAVSDVSEFDKDGDERQPPSANLLLSMDPTLREKPSWVRSRLLEIFGADPPDVILSLCSFLAKPIRKLLQEIGWNSKLIASSNNGWPHLVENFERLFDHADWVVVNNHDFFEKSGSPDRCTAISNGVDSRNFYLEQPISVRQPKVIWSGSQRRREFKGYDAFIVPIFEELRRQGIACEALLVDSRGKERLKRDQMRKWYNEATIYLCASDTEGTPNPALEAAACGCTVVSTRVGNMPELLKDRQNGVLVDQRLDDILEGLHFALAHHVSLATKLYQDIQEWNWSRRSEQYYRLFEQVARSNDKTPSSGKTATNTSTESAIPCIENQVTVFVSTINSPSFSECMKHLAHQDCRFRIEVIENVAPMSSAFQQMIDRCKTPYYVQVDEDMLLRPNAIRTLYECIEQSDEDHAIMIRLLWDDHLERAIQGVKIYRHGIVSRFPYRNVQSCERDQVSRLQEQGFKIGRPVDRLHDESSPEVLGHHGRFFHAESVYERYFTLMQKQRKYSGKVNWLDQHLVEFFERFKSDPTEFNLMAILGVLAGHLVGHHHQFDAGEKDFRKYKCLPGLKFARDFYAECSDGSHQAAISTVQMPEPPASIPVKITQCFTDEQTTGLEDHLR